MLLNTKNKQKKFIITMVIIIISATIINYGLYSLLDIYFFDTDTFGIQQNITLMIIIIGVVSILMFVLIPKENVNELMMHLENESGGGAQRTPEQEFSDMVDEERLSDELSSLDDKKK